jgi:hypothetical protein
VTFCQASCISVHYYEITNNSSQNCIPLGEGALLDNTAFFPSFSPSSLLLHTETAEGSVVPVWEQVQPQDVSVVREIMTGRSYSKNVELSYRRIPITSELPPDFSDFAE